MQRTLEKFPEEFKITKMETNKLVKGKAVSAKHFPHLHISVRKNR